MSTAITDAAWRDEEGLQVWLVIPDDVEPVADHTTLDLEQLDGGRISATDDGAITLAAVEQALTTSGWHPWHPWQEITPTRAVVAVTREPR